MNKKIKDNKNIVLIILDGIGIAKDYEYNAVSRAKTPILDKLILEYPATILKTFGNSEIGSYCIGTGEMADKNIIYNKKNKNINSKNSLSNILSKAGLKQLKIAETEKFSNITYFFNGCNENKNIKEEWMLIKNNNLDYESNPEMAIKNVYKKLIKAINSNDYNFISVNFGNADIIANTGNFDATIKTIEIIDSYLKKIISKIVRKNNIAIITSSNGNAEFMKDMQTEKINKQWTINSVPFIIIDKEFEGQNIGLNNFTGKDLNLINPEKSIINIAPTILKLLKIKKPKEMQGNSLIQ